MQQRCQIEEAVALVSTLFLTGFILGYYAIVPKAHGSRAGKWLYGFQASWMRDTPELT
jgi:hypothetical protein